MNSRENKQLRHFIWTSVLTFVCMPVISAQTNTFPTTGNAGVGTTNPSQKLEVSGGAIKITGGGLYVDNDHAIRAGGGDQSLVYRSSSNGIFFGSGDTNDFLVLNAGGSERFRLGTNGRAGLGTNSPLAMFDVANATGNLWSHWAHSTAATGQNYGILINAGTNSSDFSFRAQNSAGSAELFSVRGDGNVGIGTSSPTRKLEVNGGTTSDGSIRAYTNGGTTSYWAGLLTAVGGNAASFFVRQIDTTDYLQIGSLTNVSSLTIKDNGNVGIGTTSPVQKLQVDGGSSATAISLKETSTAWHFAHIRKDGTKLKIGSSSNDGTTGFDTYARLTINLDDGKVGIGKNPDVALDVLGDIRASGVIHAKYQDVAEWVTASEQLSAGTVVVLDSTKSNQVTSSSVSYDTRVAGVISEQPGIALGEKSEGKVLVATTGRVRVKVDASKGPIHIGDLLVTSDIPGVAMKSEPVNLGGVQLHRPGTLIGKALEPLEKGKGEILVLLSLQ